MVAGLNGQGTTNIYVGEDGFIHDEFLGDHTYETLVAHNHKLLKAMEEQKAQGKPVLVLVDLTKMGKQASGTRKGGLEGLQMIKGKYDKLALFGGPAYIMYVARFVFIAAGLGQTTGFFKTKEEAEGWLKS